MFVNRRFQALWPKRKGYTMQITQRVARYLKALLSGVLVFGFALGATAQQNLPPTDLFARSYNGWNIIGQSANTYTFNSGVCYYSPYTNGLASPFFVFNGYVNTTPYYYPVAIIDQGGGTTSEIVTPTSTTNGGGSCGMSASTVNSHTSFWLQSGTCGLAEAVGANANTATPAYPIDVKLDPYWYKCVAGLPTTPVVQNAGNIIQNLTGTVNVSIVDTTTAPWTYYTWSGTHYVVSGASTAAPTLATGAGAGGTPTSVSIVGNNTSGTVAFTTGGTAPTASATVFTLTWPAITSGGFAYAPNCTVTPLTPTVYATGTTATVAGPPAVATFTSSAVALANTTAYTFHYVCH